MRVRLRLRDTYGNPVGRENCGHPPPETSAGSHTAAEEPAFGQSGSFVHACVRFAFVFMCVRLSRVTFPLGGRRRCPQLGPLGELWRIVET